MCTSIIVAMSENGLIGHEGDLPWRLSEDLRRFKEITMGKPIIMGRKTWESIGRPLSGRPHVVISRDPNYAAEGVDVVHSFKQALARAHELGSAEIMVIGGADIYRLALPDADRMYVTEVHSEFEGDTHFPEFDRNEWRESGREGPFSADNNNLTFSFVKFDRV